ncbi:alpha/beta-hydrolase [Durotheca rogersii]|uniref:alpha/beta-hydrolase n=1 Tax=Durotheca rogersii TaxID=419775 RepID=UPI00221FD631|nr:alpha/beta-hydrolase [Durotheca rogersii]KAI5866978.1 alpha/beta-hydrolase [Durotheca rogersii]
MTFQPLDEIIRSPAFPTAIWQLEPHQSGLLPVAAGRGGPLNISWEVHGDGPVKLVLIGGIGLTKTDWQSQTLYFGHERGRRYSVLVFDNRGAGASGKPLLRYSTSEMARDLLELLDHLGWTAPRQVHVSGGSLGGMIAQELAVLAPDRIASLNLHSTAARLENAAGSSLAEVADRLGALLPRPAEAAIRATARGCFPEAWLAAADGEELPRRGTPRCAVAAAGGYGGGDGAGELRFGSNYARFAAREAQIPRDRGGLALQAVAGAFHCKTPAQLRALADRVGRARIAVLHGAADRMIPVAHGRRLAALLRPAAAVFEDGLGHAPIHQRPRWFNEFLEARCEAAEKLSGR